MPWGGIGRSSRVIGDEMKCLIALIFIINTLCAIDLFPLIVAAEKKHKVPRQIICRVIEQESLWDPSVVNYEGSIGLMQVRAIALQEYCSWTKFTNWNHLTAVEVLTNEQRNIEVGCWYLARLYRTFGNWKIALSCYNVGIGNYLKKGEYNREYVEATYWEPGM